MKKKMAILATLLIAVVGTGFSVSGTYAKYVSEINLSDDARVAKWQIGLGTGISEKLDLFDSSYTYNSNGVVVKALSRELPAKDDDTADTMDNVIAPGTKGQYTFSLDGIIETNYTLKVNATGSNGVKQPYTVEENVGGVPSSVTKTYDPIKFYVSTSKTEDIDTVDASKLLSFEKLLETLNGLYSGTTNKVFAPGTVDNTEYTIYWKWDFETTVDAQGLTYATKDSDKYDTQLGNAIAKETAEHATDATKPLTKVVTLNIDITAEQTREAVTPVTP